MAGGRSRDWMSEGWEDEAGGGSAKVLGRGVHCGE